MTTKAWVPTTKPTITEARSHGEDPDWDGLILTLDSGEVVECLIDTLPCCCEQFGVIIWDKDGVVDDLTLTLIGRTIISVDYDLTSDPPGMEEYKPHWNGCKSFVTVHLALGDGGWVKVCAYNFHNGYYPHTYRLKWPGVEDSDSL